MKKRILIDVDETIIMGHMKELAEKYLGREVILKDIEPGKYINQTISGEGFRQFFIDNNLYELGRIPEGAIEVIQKLNVEYDVYIGSTYFFPEVKEESDVILARKFNFLKKNFSFLGFSRFLFIGDKKVLTFDIAIGDSLSDLIGKESNILITSYHNKHYDNKDLDKYNATRANNWQEIEKILL